MFTNKIFLVPGVRRIVFFCLLLSLVTILAGSVITIRLRAHALQQEKKESLFQALILANDLKDELSQVDNLVRIMAGSPALARTLFLGEQKELGVADQILDRYTDVLDNAIGYVMGLDGVTIIATNRNSPASFVGKDYSFRPYFQQAIRGEPGNYLALGVTSKRRGYYASYPIKDPSGTVLGVAVIKQDLEKAEETFRQFGNCFLVGPHGVIFLSGNPRMEGSALWPIPPEKKAQIIASKQFGLGPFPTMFPSRIRDGQTVDFRGEKYLYVEQDIMDDGWSLVLMVALGRVKAYSLFGIICTGFVAVFILFFSAIVIYTEWSSRKVQESEKRFKQVALTSRDWIWEIDTSGKYAYSNNAVYDLVGISSADILKKDFFCFVLEEDEKSDLRRRMSDSESLYQTMVKIKHKDGRPVYAEITASPIRGEGGSNLGYRGVTRDVTERTKHEQALKTANIDLTENDTALKNILYDLQQANEELKEAQQQLVQSEKLSSIGQLAAGVAHEVKNPLAIIALSVQTLEKHLVDLDEKGQAIIDMIKNAAQRANKVVIELLNFSRSSDLQKTPLDVREIIEGAVAIAQNSLMLKNIAIRQDHTDEDVTVLGDRILLQQVFFNLITNAMDAIEAQGEVVISTAVDRDPDTQKEIVVIKIKDNGGGIPKDKCLKIFDPFFTTKKVGKGTGLGLSTVYMILERHQGQITVESQLGEGTIFTIILARHVGDTDSAGPRA